MGNENNDNSNNPPTQDEVNRLYSILIDTDIDQNLPTSEVIYRVVKWVNSLCNQSALAIFGMGRECNPKLTERDVNQMLTWQNSDSINWSQEKTRVFLKWASRKMTYYVTFSDVKIDLEKIGIKKVIQRNAEIIKFKILSSSTDENDLDGCSE